MRVLSAILKSFPDAVRKSIFTATLLTFNDASLFVSLVTPADLLIATCRQPTSVPFPGPLIVPYFSVESVPAHLLQAAFRMRGIRQGIYGRQPSLYTPSAREVRLGLLAPGCRHDVFCAAGRCGQGVAKQRKRI